MSIVRISAVIVTTASLTLVAAPAVADTPAGVVETATADAASVEAPPCAPVAKAAKESKGASKRGGSDRASDETNATAMPVCPAIDPDPLAGFDDFADSDPIAGL
jgi:hypothetical protein